MADDECERTRARVMLERFGDPETLERERPRGLPASTPEDRARRRRDLNRALRWAYDRGNWRGIDRP